MKIKAAAVEGPSINLPAPREPALREAMSPAPHFQRPRRIATVMLVAWLLATLASWANACLVQPSAEAGSTRGHPERVSAYDHPGADHHAAAQTRAPSESDPARQVCASFCDMEQNIVAKGQPSKGDGAADAALAPPVAFTAWPSLTLRRTEPRWRLRAEPPPPGLPVAIAFLRLTL